MKRFPAFLSIATIVLLFDRYSKWLITHHFYVGESRPVIPGVFHLTYIHNTGTAFGLFQGSNSVLMAIGMVILLFLLYGARGISERGGWRGLAGLGMVFGGALGNLVDRFHFGQVIDFL